MGFFKNELIKSSLKSGLVTFAISVGLWFTHTGWPLLWFLLIVPGIIYSFAVIPKLTNLKLPGLFGLAAILIYILCFYIAMHDHGQINPLSIGAAGITGSTLMFICYYFLQVQAISFLPTMLEVVAFSVISITPAMISSYPLTKSHPDSIDLYVLGVFTVFPLWQVLFSLALVRSINKNQLKLTDVSTRLYP